MNPTLQRNVTSIGGSDLTLAGLRREYFQKFHTSFTNNIRFCKTSLITSDRSHWVLSSTLSARRLTTPTGFSRSGLSPPRAQSFEGHLKVHTNVVFSQGGIAILVTQRAGLRLSGELHLILREVPGCRWWLSASACIFNIIILDPFFPSFRAGSQHMSNLIVICCTWSENPGSESAFLSTLRPYLNVPSRCSHSLLLWLAMLVVIYK